MQAGGQWAAGESGRHETQMFSLQEWRARRLPGAAAGCWGEAALLFGKYSYKHSDNLGSVNSLEGDNEHLY